MNLDSSILSEARSRGYSDDEILEKVSAANPVIATARERGYSLDEIASKFDQKKAKKQGGEQNEGNTQLDGNAQRKADKQIQPSSVEGTQPSQEPRTGDRQERVGQINASIAPAEKSDVPVTAQPVIQGGENIEEDAKTEGQRTQAGQEDGQGLRSEGNARDKAQVKSEGNVPSVASQLVGAAISPFGYMGEEAWKGIAGIARTFGADEVAAYALDNSARALEDSVELVGGTAPEKGGKLEFAGKTAAFIAEAPLMFTPAGMAGFLAQGYGGMKEDLRNKYLNEGLNEEEANQKSSVHASLATAATLPAYMLGGHVAGKAADAFIAQSAPAMLQLAGRFGLNGAANMVASAVGRGFAAGIEGEDALAAAKDLSLSGVLQDFAFAGHSTGSWLKGQRDKVAALQHKGITDDMLKVMLDKGQDTYLVQQEIKRRETINQEKAATDVGLPETAEVIKETAPETPRAASPQEERELSILREQAKVAGIPEEAIENFIVKNKEQGLSLTDIGKRIEDYQKLNEEITGSIPKPIKAEVEEIPEDEVDYSRVTAGGAKRLVSKVRGKFEEETETPRISAAAYKDPETGVVHEGPNHKAAMEKAGKTPIQDEAGREGKDFGYTTKSGKFISREEAQKYAEKTGQFTGKRGVRPVMHSHELDLDKFPKSRHLADSIHNGDIFKYEGSEVKLISLQEDGVLARDLKTKEEILLPKGDRGGSPEGIDGLELVRKGERKAGPMSEKTRNALREHLRDKMSKESGSTIRMSDVFADLHDYGKEIYKSGMKFADWSKQMIRDFGGKVKSVLEAIWKSVVEWNAKIGESGGIGRTPKSDAAKLEAEKAKSQEIAKPRAKKEPAPKTPQEEVERDAGRPLNEDEQEYIRAKDEGRESETAMQEREAEIDFMRRIDESSPENNPVEDSEPQTPEDRTDYYKNGTWTELEKEFEPIKPEDYVSFGSQKSKGKIDRAVDKAAKKLDLFHDDLKAIGVPLPKETPNMISGIRDAIQMIADVFDGKTIPELTKAGVKLTATQHAQARRMVEPYVQHLLAEVFPDRLITSHEMNKIKRAVSKYELGSGRLALSVSITKALNKIDEIKKEPSSLRNSKKIRDLNKQISDLNEIKESWDIKSKMDHTMEIIVKDNILGGWDAATSELRKNKNERDELERLADERIAPKGYMRSLAALDEKIKALEESIEDIEKVHDIESYAKEVESAKGTRIEDDIKRWKEKIHPVIDEYHKKINDDVNSPKDQAGRVFGARINLLSASQEARLNDFHNSDKAPPAISIVNYRNPDVRAMREGKQPQYNKDFSLDAHSILVNSIAARVNDATKIDLYKDLIAKKAAVLTEVGGDAPNIDGKPARKIEASFPMKSEISGKVVTKNRALWVKPEIYNELMQILDVNARPEGFKMLQNVTAVQVLGITDAVSHLKNLLGVVTTALGRDSAAKDIMNKIPFVGTANAIRSIRKISKEITLDGPEIRKELSDIARTSGLRPIYEQKGILSGLSSFTHELLHNVDMAARIHMSRNYANLVKRGLAKDTPEAKIDFVNQIGEYNRRLMGRHEALLRDSGFSPFIVAGRAMNRFARRLVTGQAGFEAASAKANIEARAMQVSALAMAAMVPAMINLFTTGSMFGRAGTPVGAIDFGPNFDTSDGKKRTFDFFQMVGIRRGLRQLGVNAAIEGLKNGDSLKNIQQNALNDMFTTSMHPFIGPGASLLIEVATGKRLDLRAGFSDVFTSRKVGGAAQYVENFRTGLKQQNELLYQTGVGYIIEKGMEAGGIPRPVEQNEMETIRDSGIPYIPVASELGKIVYKAISNTVGAFGGKLNSSPALKLSAQLGSKQQYDPQQDLRYKARKDILEAVQSGEGDKALQIYKKGISDGILTKADLKTLKGKIKQPDLLLQRTARLKTADEALSVFRVATAEEQDAIAMTVLKKIKGSTALTPEARKSLFDELKKSIKRSSKLYASLNK